MPPDTDMDEEPMHDFGPPDPLELQSIEDWEISNPYKPHPPKVTPLRANTKHLGEYASAFQMACDAQGLKPDFDYHEPAKGCFNVTLFIDGQLVDQIGLYASKRDAKEEVCKLAMSKLNAFGNKKGRKRSAVESGLPDIPSELGDERWINTLCEYFQGSKLGYPKFEITSAAGTMGPWTCIVELPHRSPEPFGSNIGPFSKKVDAKSAAAMEAVQWLRQQGIIPSSTKHCRRNSITSNASLESSLAENSALGLRQIDSNKSLSTDSTGQQVVAMSHKLGFTQPAFAVESADETESTPFWNMHAKFSNRDVQYEPRLAGKVGEVFHVFGKKSAKEECNRNVLAILLEIEKSRLG